MNIETAALICRVSTREQEDGYSLESQEDLLRDFSTRRGFDVPLVHKFSETASKHSRRKKFHAFMKEVARQKIRHIVVEKVDRLTRGGLKEAVLIDDWLEADEARYLHCVKDGIDLHKFSRSGDKLNWGMRVVLAKNYTDNLKEEVRKVTDTMLRKGIWPLKTPIGYIRDKSTPHSPIKLDPIRAPLIKMMFELYDTGEWSVHRLEDRIFEEGYRTSKDHRLQSGRIHLMLRYPFYIGKMRVDGKLWEGIHPQIISPVLFNRVQRRLNRPNGGVGATLYRRHSHMFRGLVHCASCGKLLTWEIQKGHTYGSCRQYQKCTNRVFIREDELEEILQPYLAAFQLTSPRLADWLHQAIKEGHKDEQIRQESTGEELERLRVKAEQRLSRLLDMRIDGSISGDDFERKKQELVSEKEIIMERLNLVSERQNYFLDDISTLINLIQGIETNFKNISAERKRTIFQHTFSHLTVSPDGTTVEYNPMFRYLSEFSSEFKSSKTLFLLDVENQDFELEKISSTKIKNGNTVANNQVWSAIRDAFRTFMNQSAAWNSLCSHIEGMSQEEMTSVVSAFSFGGKPS